MPRPIKILLRRFCFFTSHSLQLCSKLCCYVVSSIFRSFFIIRRAKEWNIQACVFPDSHNLAVSKSRVYRCVLSNTRVLNFSPYLCLLSGMVVVKDMTTYDYYYYYCIKRVVVLVERKYFLSVLVMSMDTFLLCRFNVRFERTAIRNYQLNATRCESVQRFIIFNCVRV